MRLLVTVGTTRFDQLVERVFQVLRSPRIRAEFGDVLVQLGASVCVIPPGVEQLEEDVDCWPDLSQQVTQVHEVSPGTIVTERRCARIFWFRYSRYLKDLMEDSDVILCHCGAGTLIEALRTPAAVWGVNNSALASDHQRELGEDLKRLGLIHYIPSRALRSIRTFTDAVRGARRAHSLTVGGRRPGSERGPGGGVLGGKGSAGAGAAAVGGIVERAGGGLRFLGRNFNAMYTPRTSSYVENAWPLLRDFGYSREEIAQVVQDSEYDDRLINERIANMALDGADGKGWKKVGGQPRQPRPNKKPAPRRDPDPRRHERRVSDQNQAPAARPRSSAPSSRPTRERRSSEHAEPRAEATPAASTPAVRPEHTRRAGTWAAKLKPSVAPLNLADATADAQPLPEKPTPERTAPEQPPQTRNAFSWAARLRGIQQGDPEHIQPPPSSAESEEQQPALRDGALTHAPKQTAPEEDAPPPSEAEDEPAPTVEAPVEESDHTTEETELLHAAEPAAREAPALPREAPALPRPVEPATPAAAEPPPTQPTGPAAYQQYAPATQSMPQHAAYHAAAAGARPCEQYSAAPPYQYQQHPYPAAAYRISSYYDYDIGRARAATGVAPPPPAAATSYPEYYMGYLPRLATAASTGAEGGYEDQLRAGSYGAAGLGGPPAEAGYPYYYAPYDQRRFEYMAHHHETGGAPPAAPPQSSQTGARDYREYGRPPLLEQHHPAAAYLPPPQQSAYGARPEVFRREAYYGVPPVYLAAAQDPPQQAAGPPPAYQQQQQQQQQHYPNPHYNPYTGSQAGGAGAGYYALFGSGDRRSRY